MNIKVNELMMSLPHLAFPTYIVHVSNFMGALRYSGSCSRVAIRGSWVRIPLSVYALTQGILSTIVSLVQGVGKWVPGRNVFRVMLMSAYRQRG